LAPPNQPYPNDATITFEQLHGHSDKPLKVLKSLKLMGKTRELTKLEIEMRDLDLPFDEGLTKSYHKVTKQLENEGYFDYSFSHALYRQAELVFFCVYGCYCAIEPGQYLGFWSGVLMFGIFMQRSGWFQHECNHGSVSKYESVNFVLGSFWFGMGEAGSANWWKRTHNRHHADPQRHGADVDMNTLPLAFDSVTARNGWSGFIKYQAWLYQAAVWLLVQFWQFWLHPRSIIRNRAYLDGFFLILHWVVYAKVMVPAIGLQNAIIFHLCGSGIEASLLFTNFAVSHTAMPYLSHYKREHWVERALRRTVDIHSHTETIGPVLGPIMDIFVNWLMGHLNYQVIHHLWPLMPHYKQASPRVHQAVLQMIKENPEAQLHYNVTTYWRAMYDMYANLSSIAHDHGYKLDTDAEHPTAPGWVKGTVSPVRLEK
jgi:fatty acid desaturase